MFRTLIVAQFCLAVGLVFLVLDFHKIALAFGISGCIFTLWLGIQELTWRIQDQTGFSNKEYLFQNGFEGFVLYSFLLPLYVFSPVTYLFVEEKFILWVAAIYVTLAIVFELGFRRMLLDYFVSCEEQYQKSLRDK